MTSIKSLLLLFPRTSYGARRYNQRLRREIEEHPDRALMVWERENSSQLWYVFHGMAGALQMQPLTVLRETGLIHTNLILLKDYYRLQAFFANTRIADKPAWKPPSAAASWPSNAPCGKRRPKISARSWTSWSSW